VEKNLLEVLRRPKYLKLCLKNIVHLKAIFLSAIFVLVSMKKNFRLNLVIVLIFSVILVSDTMLIIKSLVFKRFYVQLKDVRVL